MKVLLVEDEIDVGKVILSYLKQWEMEAIHAESSQDALKVLDLSDELCNVVLHHHQPEIDNTFAFLIGRSLYPFPRKARYPLAQALEDGDLKSARAFLPEGFSDQPLLTPTELVELAQAISSKVKQLTEDMRQTVQ